MKKNIRLILFFYAFILAGTIFPNLSYSASPALSAAYPPPFSTGYNSVLSQRKAFDFDLQAVEKGQFSLSLENETREALEIKVYDIIGNLIMTDHTLIQGRYSKAYDLSHYKSQLFLVEVGNATYQKLKRVVAV